MILSGNDRNEYEGYPENVIIGVEENSIADELSLLPGDILLAINGKPVKDIFDYRFLTKESYIEIVIRSGVDGEAWLLEIDKDEDEDLGIVFEPGLMDKAKSCANKCIFCFIDQLPKGMRETLYFKDDDSRLSFLQGNYVTLTNMSETDLDRVIFYRLSPINISVHATDPVLRTRMLKNPNGKKLMGYLNKIRAAGIEMNFQVVLLKNENDGHQLDKTIEDLSLYIPRGRSLSIVPVGISRHREGLYPLDPFLPEDAAKVVKRIEEWQEYFLEKYGTRFVYAADEFYLKADIPFPPVASYEDFPQIENGVGMAASFIEEFYTALEEMAYHMEGGQPMPSVSLITGTASHGFISQMAAAVSQRTGREIMVYPIVNNFFGEMITVSGLLTGKDIVEQLRGKPLGDYLFIPENALRSGEDVFLDDMTVETLSKELSVNIGIIPADGQYFLQILMEAGYQEELDK